MDREEEERLMQHLEEESAAAAKDAEKPPVLMRNIGKMVGEALPEGWGYVVLGFSFGADSRWHYVSNANREQIIKVVQAFIKQVN
jgi:hypothetical protein